MSINAAKVAKISYENTIRNFHMTTYIHYDGWLMTITFMCIWHILLLPLLNHLQSHFLYIIPWKVNKARHTTNACKIICRKTFLPPKCVKHSLWMNFSFTSAQRHVHISFIKLWIMFESFLSLSLSQLLIWINKKWLIVPRGT